MKHNVFNAFCSEAGADCLKAFRSLEFLIPTLCMPVIFYVFFGIFLAGDGSQSISILATFGVFAVMGPAIFGFGTYVAIERERGWIDLKRASPSRAFMYVGSKLAMTLLSAGFALLAIYVVAGVWASVALSRSIWLALLGVHLSAAIPFSLMGITLGFTLKSGGAIAIANVLFFALAILGGLWIPLAMFPGFMQQVAFLLPSYHLGQLALNVVGANLSEPAWLTNWVATAFFTLVFACTALYAWNKQRQ